MDTDELLVVLESVSDAIRETLSALPDWGLAGTRPGQYRSDLAADEVALTIFDRVGLGVLSEESGVHNVDRPLMAVIDPVDGSTNASHGLPWFATSICVLDGEGPLASLVVNQASGVTYRAARGKGATRDGVSISPSSTTSMQRAMVALSGFPPQYLGWRQYRTLGAAALDMCAVADGTLDAYIDCNDHSHGSWDYLGALLVCTEAGAKVAEVAGEELVVRDHGARRSPLAAANAELLEEVLHARRTLGAR